MAHHVISNPHVYGKRVPRTRGVHTARLLSAELFSACAHTALWNGRCAGQVVGSINFTQERVVFSSKEMSPSIYRRFKEALKCGEALLRAWRRSRLHPAGVLLGGPVTSVAKSTTTARSCCVTTQRALNLGCPCPHTRPCFNVAESRELAPVLVMPQC